MPNDPTSPTPDGKTLPLSQRGAEIIELVARSGGSMRIQSIAEWMSSSEMFWQWQMINGRLPARLSGSCGRN